jgi:hypothetical protein
VIATNPQLRKGQGRNRLIGPVSVITTISLSFGSPSRHFDPLPVISTKGKNLTYPEKGDCSHPFEMTAFFLQLAINLPRLGGTKILLYSRLIT